MALSNTFINSNGVIQATDKSRTGYAISEPETTVNTWDKAANIFMNVRCSSISSQISGQESSTDLLRTEEKITTSDKLIIYTSGDIKNELDLGSATINSSIVSDVKLNRSDLTSNTDVDYEVETNGGIGSYAYEVYDGGNNSSGFYVDDSDTEKYHKTKFPSPITANKLRIRSGNSYSGGRPNLFIVEASNDNVNWTVLYDNPNLILLDDNWTEINFIHVNMTMYSYYRIRSKANSAAYAYNVYELEWLGNIEIYSVDTSSVTSGEIPERTYVSNETLELNNEVLVEDENNKAYALISGATGADQKLNITKVYNEKSFSPTINSLETKVNTDVSTNEVSYISINLIEV
jgi:hypothetical protein